MSESDQENSGFERNDGHNDDDDYDFTGNNNKNGGTGKGDDNKMTAIQNHHYDEAVEVSESGSEIQSDQDPEHHEDGHKEEEEEEEEPFRQPQPKNIPNKKFEPIKASADSEGGDDDEDKTTAGQYDPANFAHLPVSSEVKDLFKYIARFKPTQVDLETKFKAFIPDYIPAIGEVDAFLKPSRPDSQSETLGLLTIDEPCLNQSKESTMWLLINALSTNKKKDGIKRIVNSIENADSNPKEINKWIQDVSSIQRQAPSVVYTKRFPAWDQLMEVWPAEVEDALQGFKLPTEELDMTTEEYAKLCCAILDIPVHQTSNGKNLIESLHVMFTLYDEFRSNQHFQQQNENFVYEGTGNM